MVTQTQVKTLQSNKVPIYKTILKPIWTLEYNSGIQFPLLTRTYKI
jgi:hypothetical protein